MSGDLYNYFVNHKDGYVNISTRLKRPLEVSYSIHSFGDRRDTMDQKEKDQWTRAGGLDAFLEYNMVGYSTYPEPFVDNKCELLVNSLGSLDRFENLADGVIGDGWFELNQFLFRVWLPPHVADSLLKHVMAADRRYMPDATALELAQKWKEGSGGWAGEENRIDILKLLSEQLAGGDDQSTISLRFDLCDLNFHERLNRTSYRICRIYA